MRDVVSQDIKVAVCGTTAVLLAVAVYIIINWAPNFKYVLIDGVNKLLYIPEYPFTAARDLVKFGNNWMLERETLRQQLARFEAQNRAQAEALQKAGIAIPNATVSCIPARVILRYPDNWWTEAKINKGSSDKVQLGAAVVSDGYLVGRITRVDKHSAWFEMITSSAFLIAAVIDETRDLGVITGDNKGNLQMLYITADRYVKKNMKVSTSLIGDQIPAGLAIGTIVGKNAPEEGYVPLRVSAGAHLTQLYDVEVYTEAVK